MPQMNQQPWWAQTNRPYQSQNQWNNYGFPGTAQNPKQPTFVLYGKMVDREEDIKVGDVPMDGTPGFFPLSDWSAIIAKAWSNDGQIRVMRYVAEDIRPSQTTPMHAQQPDPVPVPAPQPQQPAQTQLTVEQVGQMIDTKIGQLITALIGNQQQQAVQSTQQSAPQPPKQQNKTKKEEAQ